MMYSGPGSGPMMAASAAWDGLAADLASTATSYQSVVSGLTGAWQGASAGSMTGAAETYLSWITGTAAQAEQAGAQAKAAGTAFDSAFAATVAPPVITANRTLLTSLIATNLFGQNAPAIAATEADYAEMWAQDVAMMTSYAESSIQATILQPFTAAPQVANGALGALQSAVAAPTQGSNILGALPQLVPTALTQLLTPTASDPASGGLSGILSSLGGLLGTGSGSTSTSTSLEAASVGGQLGYYAAMYPSNMLMQLANASRQATTGLTDSQGLLNVIGQFVDGKLQLVAGNLANQLRSFGSAVTAQLSHATSLSGLSVPQAWSAAAPGMIRAAPVLPNTSVSAPTLPPSAGMPGGPFGQALMGALSGRGLSNIAAKTAKVVPRSPAGG
jgi:PPE-repeat protein